MKKEDFEKLTKGMKNQRVERPNKASAGTLSGHAAGEPFEKCVYKILKQKYPNNIFKQYEYLNDIYLRHPKHITVEQKYALFDSPTALFLLNRGNKATKEWTPENLFEEKQNDTADILYHEPNYYGIIDVKTRNIDKAAMAPNIVSAYKLARMCALMIDNEEFDTLGIDYIEIDWTEEEKHLRCTDAHYANLFKAKPEALYINWSAALQIQFHVCDLDQSWSGTMEEWARHYLKVFVDSAETRMVMMREKFIEPFRKYILNTENS